MNGMKGIADRAAMAENTSRGLLVLILLFLLLIGVIIAFSRTFITTVAGADPAASTAALIVAALLPLVLMAVTVFQFTRLMRQRALRKPGAGLRLRLLLFFILVAALSAGRVLEPWELESAAARLGAAVLTRHDRRQFDLWNSWPWFILILALCTAEWVLRKKVRLP